jgi:hypothetical protein
MFLSKRRGDQRGDQPAGDSSLQVLMGGDQEAQSCCIKKTPLAFCMRPRSAFFNGCGFSRRPREITNEHLKGAMQFPSKYDPKIKLDTYTFVLSLNDISLNAIGMEKLLQASKPPSRSSGSKDKIARAIVYGGDGDSAEQQLRYTFLGFLCDDYPGSVDDRTKEKSSGRSSEDKEFYHSDKDDESEYLRGSNWGVLHIMALKVVMSCLEQVLAMSDQTPDPIDFSKDPFWPGIVDTLRNNIEMLHSNKIIGLSLKTLRLLHSFEPVVLKQLLQHTFMPYLIHLVEYGKSEKVHRIESEASRLLKRAQEAPLSTKKDAPDPNNTESPRTTANKANPGTKTPNTSTSYDPQTKTEVSDDTEATESELTESEATGALTIDTNIDSIGTSNEDDPQSITEASDTSIDTSSNGEDSQSTTDASDETEFTASEATASKATESTSIDTSTDTAQTKTEAPDKTEAAESEATDTNTDTTSSNDVHQTTTKTSSDDIEFKESEPTEPETTATNTDVYKGTPQTRTEATELEATESDITDATIDISSSSSSSKDATYDLESKTEVSDATEATEFELTESAGATGALATDTNIDSIGTSNEDDPQSTTEASDTGIDTTSNGEGPQSTTDASDEMEFTASEATASKATESTSIDTSTDTAQTKTEAPDKTEAAESEATGTNTDTSSKDDHQTTTKTSSNDTGLEPETTATSTDADKGAPQTRTEATEFKATDPATTDTIIDITSSSSKDAPPSKTADPDDTEATELESSGSESWDIYTRRSIQHPSTENESRKDLFDAQDWGSFIQQ